MGLQRAINFIYLYFQRMQTLQKLESMGLLRAIEQAAQLSDDEAANPIKSDVASSLSYNMHNTLYIFMNQRIRKPTLRRHK
jgi:hypothetical protein